MSMKIYIKANERHSQNHNNSSNRQLELLDLDFLISYPEFLIFYVSHQIHPRHSIMLPNSLRRSSRVALLLEPPSPDPQPNPSQFTPSPFFAHSQKHHPLLFFCWIFSPLNLDKWNERVGGEIRMRCEMWLVIYNFWILIRRGWMGRWEKGKGNRYRETMLW